MESLGIEACELSEALLGFGVSNESRHNVHLLVVAMQNRLQTGPLLKRAWAISKAYLQHFNDHRKLLLLQSNVESKEGVGNQDRANALVDRLFDTWWTFLHSENPETTRNNTFVVGCEGRLNLVIE